MPNNAAIWHTTPLIEANVGNGGRTNCPSFAGRGLRKSFPVVLKALASGAMGRNVPTGKMRSPARHTGNATSQPGVGCVVVSLFLRSFCSHLCAAPCRHHQLHYGFPWRTHRLQTNHRWATGRFVPAQWGKTVKHIACYIIERLGTHPSPSCRQMLVKGVGQPGLNPTGQGGIRRARCCVGPCACRSSWASPCTKVWSRWCCGLSTAASSDRCMQIRHTRSWLHNGSTKPQQSRTQGMGWCMSVAGTQNHGSVSWGGN